MSSKTTLNTSSVEQQRIELGRQLKQIRLSRKIPKTHIERITGMQPHQVIAIEAGSRSYTIDGLIRYINALEGQLKYQDDKSAELYKLID